MMLARDMIIAKIEVHSDKMLIFIKKAIRLENHRISFNHSLGELDMYVHRQIISPCETSDASLYSRFELYQKCPRL